MSNVHIWPETAGRLAARAMLAGIAQDESQALDVRLTALEAIGELQDDLPAGYILGSVDVTAGTIEQARQLLLTDVAHQSSVRDALATSRAAARLSDL